MSNETTNFPKVYDPQSTEARLYQKWVDNGYFTAHVDKTKESYTIVIPPPNITGQLHMGHALDNTLQDILIRFKRMQGYSTLWLPGTDHASIATEVKIIEMLAKEGVTKYDLGREKFLERAWEWKKEYGGRITKQLRMLGSSLDWTRERFTMDEGCNKAVRHVFVSLYNKGLIYRGERITNWCCECNTALSDAEVEYQEDPGFFWHIKYPIKDSDEFITFATTRPETMLGDTAVAVHPEDERYTHLIGKTLILPLVNREIPVIADEYVDREFGTGVVKITPAHDPNDFEVGQRHNLPIVKVINDDGTMNKLAGKYEGLDRYEARKQIVSDLDALGLLIKVEPHAHNVGHCYRCHSTVEPMVSTQWFVKMKPLAEPAIAAVRNKETVFIPERFDKIYYNWMENIRDWCISRQLWWGHRIPAWYCKDCGEIIVSEDTPTKCPKCGCEHLKQDEDVLDTWFSSALWPFSTLGWPDKTEDLDYFFPTTTLVTGYDIIFFWVSRMIFSSIENMGEVPFKNVLIHGLVRDDQGRKMSKSLGNGVDPIEVINSFGADALRFSLVAGTTPGNDMRYYDSKVRAYRDFANKIWNASRFIVMNLENAPFEKPDDSMLTADDKWIMSRLNEVTKEVTSNMENFDLGVAALKLYDFIWTEFCDWYIELTKIRLYSDDLEQRKTAIYVLVTTLTKALQLLHPFMPFITEEIWLHLPHENSADETIMLTKWPEYSEELKFEEAEAQMNVIMDVIRAVRNLRAEMDIKNSKKLDMILFDNSGKYVEMLESGRIYIEKFANTSNLRITTSNDGVPANAKVVNIGTLIAYFPIDELVDFTAELTRLEAEKETATSELKRAEGKLSNEKFVSKAPAKLVDEEKAKVQKYTEALASIQQQIDAIKAMM
ncbi:MAG: valine--tRNA ligase [Clostridiales bacterium]|nr:valine--tRNA ligase [Clostridiales bacterium]